MPENLDVQQGNLTPMVLKSPDLDGPLQGHGIEPVSGVHLAVTRGASLTNRRASAGHKQLQTETVDVQGVHLS